MTDSELVRRSKDGDLGAFDVLVLRYRRRITALTWRFVRDPSDAEDLAQEAFVRAFTRIEKLKADVPFQNWLYRVTVNLCLDRLRREKSALRRVEPESSEDEQSWLERRAFRNGAAHQSGLDERLIAQQLVRRALSVIAPKDRVVLHLLYCEGCSVEETAVKLGWTKVNVKVRAFRARAALRKYLEKLDASSGGEES